MNLAAEIVSSASTPRIRTDSLRNRLVIVNNGRVRVRVVRRIRPRLRRRWRLTNGAVSCIDDASE